MTIKKERREYIVDVIFFKKPKDYI